MTRTLPARAYRDPDLFEQELDVVFGRAWTLVGHVSELREPGQYRAVTIGRERVAVVRGQDGELRALSNVCRHRGSVLLEGGGACPKVIRCPYHAWTYRLDGRLAAAPSARGFSGLRKKRMRLPEFRVAELGGLVFACTDPDAPGLEEVLGVAAPFIESLGLERLRVIRSNGSDRYVEEFSENWKVLIDNYLEDYHVPVAHPALVRLLDVKRTEGEESEYSEWSYAPLREKRSRRGIERLYQWACRPMPGWPERLHRVWATVGMWPATFLEIYPHHVDTWQLEPRGLASSSASTLTLVHPEAGPRDRLARTLCHRIQGGVMEEDVEITERVQRGVAAPSYRAGPLNEDWESSVIRFQTTLRRQLPRIEELEAEDAERSGAPR